MLKQVQQDAEYPPQHVTLNLFQGLFNRFQFGVGGGVAICVAPTSSYGVAYSYIVQLLLLVTSSINTRRHALRTKYDASPYAQTTSTNLNWMTGKAMLKSIIPMPKSEIVIDLCGNEII